MRRRPEQQRRSEIRPRRWCWTALHAEFVRIAPAEWCVRLLHMQTCYKWPAAQVIARQNLRGLRLKREREAKWPDLGAAELSTSRRAEEQDKLSRDAAHEPLTTRALAARQISEILLRSCCFKTAGLVARPHALRYMLRLKVRESWSEGPFRIDLKKRLNSSPSAPQHKISTRLDFNLTCTL